MQKSTVVDSATGKSKDSRSAFLTILLSCHLCLILKKEVFLDLIFIPLPLLLLFYFFILKYHHLCNILIKFRVRTSSGTFLARGRDKIIRNIEKKIADFTFLPMGMWFEPPMFLYVFVDQNGSFCFIFCLNSEWIFLVSLLLTFFHYGLLSNPQILIFSHISLLDTPFSLDRKEFGNSSFFFKEYDFLFENNKDGNESLSSIWSMEERGNRKGKKCGFWFLSVICLV